MVISHSGRSHIFRRLYNKAWDFLRRRRPFRWAPGVPKFVPGKAEELPEKELIQLAKLGGTQGKYAFGILVERHQAWLVRYLYFLLGGSTEAEDVAQEALVRAFLALERFRGDSTFKTWMRPIATRLAFNHRRDRATRQKYEDMLETPESSMGGEMGSISRDALLKVLVQLSYPYREILVLRYIEDMDIKEVAQSLNIGLSATKMRLSRARSGFWEQHQKLAA